MVYLGLVVCSMVVAMYLPIFELATTIWLDRRHRHRVGRPAKPAFGVSSAPCVPAPLAALGRPHGLIQRR